MAALAVTALTPRRRVPVQARRWLAAVAWVTTATWLQLSRSSRVPLWNIIWAEDGRFFYGEARRRALHSTLFEPLAGYLQLLPRLLAGAAAQLPTADAALALSVSAALCCALLSLYVYVAVDWLAFRWQRALLAALVVLHPAAAFEVNSDLNNLHWYLIFAAFWACLSRATSTRRICLDVFVVTLAMLSDPLTLLLLPLPLIRLRAARRNELGTHRKQSSWLLATFAVTAMLQYGIGLAGHTPHRSASSDVSSLPSAFALRVATSAVFGDRMLATIWHPGRHWIAAAVLLAVCLTAAFAIIRSDGRIRWTLIAVYGYSVIFFVVPLVIRGGAGNYLRLPFSLNGSRYTIVPLWFLYSGWILGIGLLGPAIRRQRVADHARSWPVAVLAGFPLAVLLVANFAEHGPRSSGASWRQAVTVARRTCSLGVLGRPIASSLPSVARPRLLSRTVVALPIPPWDSKLFWAVRLRCDQL